MIRFVCECGKQLQAREENAGKLVRCPACTRQLTVPLELPPSGAVQIEEPAAPAAPPERVNQKRPLLRNEPDMEHDSESRDRNYRRNGDNSGKAIASLVLGILSLFCNLVAGLPALILGLLALRDIGRSRGRLSGHGLAIAGIASACVCTLLSCVMLFAFLLPAMVLPAAVQRVREAAGRAQSMNNLKQMALALQNYNEVYGSLPPAGVGDPAKRLAANKSRLSWRVAILPFLGENNLYQQFKLDEPWDSPNNKQLLAQMPTVYNCPAVTTASGQTVYQVFVGNGAAFERTKRTTIPIDFPDGLSNTILIVEAAQAVPWTKPDDIPFNPRREIKPLLGSNHRGSFLVVLADGSTRVMQPEISENTLKAAITRNGRDALGPDW